MVHRGIATVSGVLMVCFFLLANYEPQFFMLHFYQALMYLAIILLLFYFEDHWAYAIGMQVPLVWIILSFGTGLLGSAMEQVWRLFKGEPFANRTGPLAMIIAIVGMVMIVTCARHWKREISGLRIAKPTFFISTGIVLVYYVILITWFWRMFPQTSGSPTP